MQAANLQKIFHSSENLTQRCMQIRSCVHIHLYIYANVTLVKYEFFLLLLIFKQRKELMRGK